LDVEKLLRVMAEKNVDELDSLPKIEGFPEFEKMRDKVTEALKSGDLKCLVGSLEDITKVLSDIAEEKK